MTKIVLCYEKEKEKNNNFLKDLISELKKQNTFYIIDSIFLEETEKETKYTANVVFMNKRNRGKVYIPAKKTDDAHLQIPTKDVVV
jgi:hypothetical protein